MKREWLVALVIAITVAIVLAVGIYLIASSNPRGTPLPPPSAQEWTVSLEKGLTYGKPVYGPTTPLNDATGGLWVINGAQEGIIQMNLTRFALGYNEDPFAAGNDSVRLDVSADFAESGRPLRAVYYIVPAKDAAMNGSTGPSVLNGAIAFFAGTDFVAADPFNRTVFFRYPLPFVPTWTGEDPASAGDMLIAPLQRVVPVGLFTFPVGPYEYFWASDGSHTVVFELTYVHGGYCPCDPPSGRVVLFANESLAAPPLVYYNVYHVDSATNYRSGPGAAILLPLANHTLEIQDTEPRMRAWVPLTLGGQPASLVGSIGFVQASFPLQLLLPVRSSSSTGLLVLDLADLSKVFEYTAGDASWQPAATPWSRAGSSVYTAWYSPRDNATRFVGLNGVGDPIPQSVASVPGRTRSVFLAYEAGKEFAQTEAGSVWTLNTTYPTSANVTPVSFALALPSTSTAALYAGSPGGTRFGTLLSSIEILGGWTDSASATTAMFRLVPLPGSSIASSSRSPDPPRSAVSTWTVPWIPVSGSAVSSGRRT